MLVGHVFDFALILRSRRRDLRLRQEDLAKKAGVSRGFIVDLEHGKDSVEFGKVLRVMDAMAVPMSVGWNNEPPDWTKPIIKRVMARERRCAQTRPGNFRPNAAPTRRRRRTGSTRSGNARWRGRRTPWWPTAKPTRGSGRRPRRIVLSPTLSPHGREL